MSEVERYIAQRKKMDPDFAEANSKSASCFDRRRSE